MNTLEAILNEKSFNFKIFEKVSDGETSEIFIGQFNKRKSMFKLSKKNTFNLLINEYLKNDVIENIKTKNITPKIFFYDKKIGLLIYEYVEMESSKKLLKNIHNIGEKLKQLHQIKFNKKMKTFEDQFNLYLSQLKPELNNRYLIEAVELFNHLKKYESENVFSHNDLNSENILINKKDIFFIDYEYSSINSKYSDISKIINSLELNDLEKTKFLKGYGIENKSNDIDTKIESWSLMNSYTELIWALYLKKLSKGLIKEKYLESLMTNIKQQTL